MFAEQKRRLDIFGRQCCGFGHFSGSESDFSNRLDPDPVPHKCCTNIYLLNIFDTIIKLNIIYVFHIVFCCPRIRTRNNDSIKDMYEVLD
jgi:hypothetical protein